MALFPRRGEIWLVDFPDDPKSRPALIVSPDTSCDSMARCENLSYLLKSRLNRGPLAGSISLALMHDVERCLLRALGLTT